MGRLSTTLMIEHSRRSGGSNNREWIIYLLHVTPEPGVRKVHRANPKTNLTLLVSAAQTMLLTGLQLYKTFYKNTETIIQGVIYGMTYIALCNRQMASLGLQCS